MSQVMTRLNNKVQIYSGTGEKLLWSIGVMVKSVTGSQSYSHLPIHRTYRQPLGAW